MARFFENIGQKLGQACSWVTSRVKAAAQATVDSVKGWVERYRQRMAAIKRHKEYKQEVLDSEQTYTPEPVDVDLRDRLKERLDKLPNCNEGLVSHLKSLTPDERKAYVTDELLPAIANEMGVTCGFKGWFMHPSLAGGYNHEENAIQLNAAYLVVNDTDTLNDFVNTIIHEYKHARQWEAVSGLNTHGYSEALIAEWRRNFDDYITPQESDEAYVKQPVEWDAAGFAESVYPSIV